MSGPLLLLDATYLCHRAYHAVGDMMHNDRGTGAVFGVLRDIVQLQEFFRTTRTVFAFDPGGHGHRHKILPTYKATRHKRHAEESDKDKAGRADFQRQIRHLRDRHLPAAGFRNVFTAPGFEADDIIAQIAAGVPEDDEAIIVGSDQDLWQCIRPNVTCWNPQTRKGYGEQSFRAQWGIQPHRWADVKALAGCSSDDVPGLPGVGEKTAARWLCGTLGAHTQAYKKLAGAKALHHRNIKLTRLPFLGTPEFEIQPDEVTETKWAALADELGMRTLRDTAPRAVGRKSKGRKRATKETGFGLAGS